MNARYTKSSFEKMFPSLVIFGPQKDLPDPDSLARLRLVLLSEPNLSSFVTAIKDLPEFWHTLLEAHPSLDHVPGSQMLTDLKEWIIHGYPPQASSPPNVLLTPLSIVGDIAHYLHYMRLCNMDGPRAHVALLESIKDNGPQGFCVGLLSAFALACSRDEPEMSVFGSVALRLAVCVGAFVDLGGAFADPPDNACCLDVCSDLEHAKSVPEVLRNYPEVSADITTDSF